jgi:hypothetical protein
MEEEKQQRTVYDMACDTIYETMNKFEKDNKVGFNTMQWCYVLTLTQGLIMASQINQWDKATQEAKDESPRTNWAD